MSGENEAPGTPGAPDEHIEVEISDLAPAGTGMAPRRVGLQQHRSWRWRLARLLAVLASVLLALAVVLSSFAAVRERAAQLIFGPTPVPTATLEPGGDDFYILSGLPWASVTLDGHPLRHLSVIGKDPPLRLARGQHVLDWHADPFQSWRCTISVPVTSGDTCPYDRGYVGKPTGREFWVVLLYPTLHLLPNNQWTSLVGAIQTLLDGLQSSTTVLPGESYLADLAEPVPGGEVIETTTQALHATLRFHAVLETPTSSGSYPTCGPAFPGGCTFVGQSCLLLCTAPEASSPGYWSALAPAYGTWDYATVSGKAVASDQPDGGQGTLVPLRITWNGAGWHVALAPGNPTLPYTSVSSLSSTNPVPIGQPACAAVQASAEFQGYPLTGTPALGYGALSWRFVSGAPPAAGCLAVGTPLQDVAGTPASALPPAYVLQRFGVAIAANTAAQQAWPELPVADAYEQALAQQLAGKP